MIHHPARPPDWLLDAYPSHLHINILPRLKGQGHGRRLLIAWHARSRAMGSTGFYLGVDPRNTSAIGFYKAMGLDRLVPASTTVTDDVIWFGARDLQRNDKPSRLVLCRTQLQPVLPANPAATIPHSQTFRRSFCPPTSAARSCCGSHCGNGEA